MASYVQAESFCQASVPVRATSTSCPSAVRMSFTRADIVSLSSATKIRIRAASFPSVASPGVSAGAPAFRREAPPSGPGAPFLDEGRDHPDRNRLLDEAKRLPGQARLDFRRGPPRHENQAPQHIGARLAQPAADGHAAPPRHGDVADHDVAALPLELR